MSCTYDCCDTGHGHHHTHGHHGHHGHHHHGHHGYHGYHGHGHGARSRGPEPTLRVRQGDVLTCGCGACDVELTVTKACEGSSCGTGCEVAVSCCGEPMTRKAA